MEPRVRCSEMGLAHVAQPIPLRFRAHLAQAEAGKLRRWEA